MKYSPAMKCDIDVRRELYGNVVLSGGTTMLPGMSERLNKEIAALVSMSIKVKMITPGAEVRNAVQRVDSGVDCYVSAYGDQV